MNCQTVRIYSQSLLTKLRGLLLSILGGLPLQVGLFRNAQLESAVRGNIAKNEYDVIYAYYLRSAPVVPKHLVGSSVSFLAMQLSQTLNTERLYLDEKKFWKKFLYWLEWRLLARYESRVWRNFDRVVLIGPQDVQAIQAVCRQKGQPEMDNWIYGAHGTDTQKFVAAGSDEVVGDRVVFSGSMLYAPNVQAVLWFVNHCWPKILAERPGAEFIVQGRDPVPEICSLHGHDGIVVTGTVPDVGAYIRSAAVCVAPIRAAGGMQNKIIEYMASAKALVATSIANEGIMAPLETLSIADSADEFAAEVVFLLSDASRARDLGKRARDFVLANWTWEAHFLKLEENMYSALEGKRAPEAVDRVS
jgi:glycosyltransferase involved in cell wall biosynthesis